MADQIKDMGQGGLCTDLPPMLVPMNTFTDVNNVRFDDNSVQVITGEALYRTVSIAPDFGVHWRRPDQSYNIFAKNGIIVRVDAAGNTSGYPTGTPMLSSSDAKYSNSDWHSTLFNGGYAVVMNNGKSTPLYCLYNGGTADTQFVELPGWNYTVGQTITAKVVRSLNYSLVAANLTVVGTSATTNAPGTIRVSAQAAAGSIPQIWQPGTTTDTADEFELSSTSPILDMLELRGNMFIYSQDCINILTIGATSRVQPYSKSYGIISTDCVCEFDGSHFVVDRNDIYVHNGSGSIQSLADFRIKKYFFGQLNKAALEKMYVVKNPFNKEIWICYPKGSSTVCTEALIYQYKTNTWSKRTLVGNTYGFTGPRNINSTWEYAKEVVYMTTNTTQTLVTDDNYLMWNGTALVHYLAYIEKKRMNTGDVSGSTLVSAIYPIFDKVPNDSSITVRVRGQNNYVEDVDLSVDDPDNKDTFISLPNIKKSQGYKVDPRVNGRVLNYRISAMDYWRLSAMAIDARPADRR
jgi:hypothetical protein